MPLSVEVCIWRPWLRLVIALVLVFLFGLFAPDHLGPLVIGGPIGGWLAISLATGARSASGPAAS